jgi:hypothetical protein
MKLRFKPINIRKAGLNEVLDLIFELMKTQYLDDFEKNILSNTEKFEKEKLKLLKGKSSKSLIDITNGIKSKVSFWGIIKIHD